MGLQRLLCWRQLPRDGLPRLLQLPRGQGRGLLRGRLLPPGRLLQELLVLRLRQELLSPFLPGVLPVPLRQLQLLLGLCPGQGEGAVVPSGAGWQLGGSCARQALLQPVPGGAGLAWALLVPPLRLSQRHPHAAVGSCVLCSDPALRQFKQVMGTDCVKCPAGRRRPWEWLLGCGPCRDGADF